MEIRSLDNITIDTIFHAFEQAFADYDVQADKEQLQSMLKRRGFNAGLSFAAFEGSKITSFILNGTGNFNNIPAVYDTGTGTLKQYRGKGLASKIFEYSVPYLKKAGIKQYLLEVLQHNTPAVSLYKNLGFEITREFNYFIQLNKEIDNKIKLCDISYSIKQIDIDDLVGMKDFCDFYPSWQNSSESIKRAANNFFCLGTFIENEPVGYCVFEPVSGDITRIAVDKQHRRKGIASRLLNEMLKLNKSNAVKVINTDISCCSVTDFLRSKNIEITGKQFEMIKRI